MTEQSCPDAATLAAFTEGALDVKQRAEVERHVANCPECPALIGEVTHFLADEAQADPEPAPPSRHRWWHIVAAAVAALCLPVIALWRTMSSPDPSARLRSIAAASSVRHYEGRLHEFPPSRFRATRNSERVSVLTAVRAEAERLAERADDADVLHARGVAALMSHDPAEATRLLNAAARVTPTDPAIWNDLAVAELARASLGNTTALPAALHAARRATTLAPISPDAHYNHALALEHLGRNTEAIAAYRQALTYATSTLSRTEISERLQRLEMSN